MDGLTGDLPPAEWAISKVMWKYPSCAETHTSIEAAISIARDHRIEEGDVEFIELGFTPHMLPRLLLQVDRIPRTTFEAQFSIQFCAAVGLLDGAFGPEQVTDEKVKDPRVARLMDKVKPFYAHRDFYSSPDQYILSSKEGVPHFAVVLTVKMRDGEEYTRKVLSARLPESDLVNKFRNNSKAVLKQQNIEKSINLVMGLEKLDDVTLLIEQLHD